MPFPPSVCSTELFRLVATSCHPGVDIVCIAIDPDTTFMAADHDHRWVPDAVCHAVATSGESHIRYMMFPSLQG